MKIHCIAKGWVAAVVALGFAGQAYAVPNYFTADAVLPGGLGTLNAERALFQNAALAAGAPLSLEGFETFTNGPGPLNFGDFTVAETVGTPGFTQLTGNNLITTEGNSVLSFNTDNPTHIELSFGTGINAFGVDITSIDSTATTVSFFDDLGNVLDNFALNGNFAGATFFGVVNDQTFSTVRFEFTGSEIINLDQLEYGTSVVPEPSALILLGLGVGAIGLLRRRKNITAA